jgi:hypothetical protein
MAYWCQLGAAQTTFQVGCVPFGVEGESFGARGLGLELFCCQRMAHLRSSAENPQTFVSILGDDGILARSELWLRYCSIRSIS